MQNVLIIGTTGSIDSQLVSHLAKENYQLILSGKKKLSSFTYPYIQADLTQPVSISKLVDQVKKQLNHLDLFIYAAGVANYNTLDESTPAIWDETKFKCQSSIFLTKELIPLFQKASKPLALYLGSGAGSIPMRARSIYCASKFALRCSVLSLAEEFDGQKPDFCLIILGSTLTDFGNKTIKQKQQEAKQGKAYFPVKYVADQLIKIINNQNQDTEIVLSPSEHGFGTGRSHKL